MKDFRDLKVWEKAHSLTLEVYKITKNFPKEELYGLTSQMRRSSSSIATNIAEGCGRNSAADFARFLQIAIGSASELEYQIQLGYDLEIISNEDFSKLPNGVIQIKKMLTKYIQKLTAEN
jgi:four helix bundle protein